LIFLTREHEKYMGNKRLKVIIKRSGGRDTQGQVSVRGRGGGSKRFLRFIDFKRDKKNITGVVEALDYDPNRNLKIALVLYEDGERRYILAPEDLKVGDWVKAGKDVEIKVGNCLPLKNIPIGTPIHNLELTPAKGGQIVRGAGSMAVILSKENDLAQVKLPSGEVRLFPLSCWASIGQLGNMNQKFKKLGKAGEARRRGIKPKVRGVAQNPRSHPHGGGEGRSGIGMARPKTRWGKTAFGKKTRSKMKYSDKFIIKKRG